nr:hypothetical protein [Tanacetum cinerariifolium]
MKPQSESLMYWYEPLVTGSSGIGNNGGVHIGSALDRSARINVDGAANLIKTIDALVRGSIIGGGGGGGSG